MIVQILDRLYVGDSEFTEEQLDQHKITHVINVGGVDLQNDRVKYVHHLSDDGKNPAWKFSTILRHIEGILTFTYSHRLLIVCREGKSRSAFIILLWLQKMGMSRDEAYQFIKEKHPIAQVNLDLLRSG